MRKISYRPKKNHTQNKQVDIVNHMQEEASVEDNIQENYPIVEETVNQFEEEVEVPEVMEKEEEGSSQLPKETIELQVHKQNTNKMDNLKVVGDMDCDYHIYLEDYVYTYLYQYAYADLSKESSAILIGEVYLDSKEAIIRGIIPVNMDKLSPDNEWIGPEVLDDIEEQRKQYFADQDIIGWMHMQPGYGTMLTMKELREHRSVFEGSGCLFMLVDAINKIESVYVYEEDELKEQSGYCMYYERNEEMQKYMLDHPFAKKETEEIKDTVVNQFREIGKQRKEEYKQRRSVNMTAITAALVLIALTGVIVQMNHSRSNVVPSLSPTLASNAETPNEDGLIVEKQGEDQTVAMEQSPANTEETMEQSQEAFSEVKPNSDVAIESPTAEANNEQMTEAATPTDKQNTEQTEQSTTEATPTTEQVAESSNEASTEVTPAQEQEAGDYDIYVVKSGDTLANISYNKYGDAKRSVEVAKLNGLKDTNQIYVGQELKMPK